MRGTQLQLKVAKTVRFQSNRIQFIRRLDLPMISTLLNALMIIALTLAGCADREKTLIFWIVGAPQEVDYWKTLVGEFQRTSGISVDLIRRPSSTDQRKQGLVCTFLEFTASNGGGIMQDGHVRLDRGANAVPWISCRIRSENTAFHR